MAINYEESISQILDRAAIAGREIMLQVSSANENGAIAWHGPERMMQTESAEALNYIYGYLDSVGRTDLYVEVPFKK